MKRPIKIKTASVTLLIVFTCLPILRAVFPPPDGGYAGGNTAVGASALLSLTTGTFNTAAGLFSLMSNTEGEFNTGYRRRHASQQHRIAKHGDRRWGAIRQHEPH